MGWATKELRTKGFDHVKAEMLDILIGRAEVELDRHGK